MAQSPADLDHPPTDFEQRLITFLNQLCKRRKLAAAIAADTHLFETKILDSVQFLELMNFLQVELEVEVPDQMLSMEFFVTPRAIATNFGPSAAAPAAGQGG